MLPVAEFRSTLFSRFSVFLCWLEISACSVARGNLLHSLLLVAELWPSLLSIAFLCWLWILSSSLARGYRCLRRLWALSLSYHCQNPLFPVHIDTNQRESFALKICQVWKLSSPAPALQSSDCNETLVKFVTKQTAAFLYLISSGDYRRRIFEHLFKWVHNHIEIIPHWKSFGDSYTNKLNVSHSYIFYFWNENKFQYPFSKTLCIYIKLYISQPWQMSLTNAIYWGRMV